MTQTQVNSAAAYSLCGKPRRSPVSLDEVGLPSAPRQLSFILWQIHFHYLKKNTSPSLSSLLALTTSPWLSQPHFPLLAKEKTRNFFIIHRQCSYMTILFVLDKSKSEMTSKFTYIKVENFINKNQGDRKD